MSKLPVMLLHLLIVILSTPSGTQNKVEGGSCEGCYPLGMQSGAIPDSSITASSYLEHEVYDCRPHNSRLGQGGFNIWLNDYTTLSALLFHPWIQVDFQSPHTLSGLQMEGYFESILNFAWVEEITLQTGLNESALSFLKDGQEKVRLFYDHALTAHESCRAKKTQIFLN